MNVHLAAIGQPYIPGWADLGPFIVEGWLTLTLVGLLLAPFFARRRNLASFLVALAGLTAALYSARANLNPVVIEGASPGGQLTITTDVENYPGFEHGIQGPELMDVMRRPVTRFGARFLTGDVSAARLGNPPFELTIDGETLECEALIIATGASAKLLGCSFDALGEAVLREWNIPDTIVQALDPLPAGVLKQAKTRQDWLQQVAAFSGMAARLLPGAGNAGKVLRPRHPPVRQRLRAGSNLVCGQLFQQVPLPVQDADVRPEELVRRAAQEVAIPGGHVH